MREATKLAASKIYSWWKPKVDKFIEASDVYSKKTGQKVHSKKDDLLNVFDDAMAFNLKKVGGTAYNLLRDDYNQGGKTNKQMLEYKKTAPKMRKEIANVQRALLPTPRSIHPSVRAREIPLARQRPQMKFNMTRSSKTRTGAAPVAVGISTTSSPYKFAGRDSMTVSHSEYVGDVVSTGSTFNATQFAVIQPGDPIAFPWLSSLAGRFEMYRLHKLSFKYLPACSSSTNGTVIVAFDRNAARAVPTSKTMLMEYQDCIRDVPWMAGGFSVGNISDKKYLRFGNGTVSLQTITALVEDIKTYAVGQLFVGCDGISAGTVGEVWMDFEIELMNPGIFITPEVMINVNSAVTSSAYYPFDAAGLNVSFYGNMRPTSIGTDSLLKYELPPGQYLSLFTCELTGSGESGSPNITGTGVTANTPFTSGTGEAGHYFCLQVFVVTIGTVVSIDWTTHPFSKIASYPAFRILPYEFLAYV